MCNGVNKLNEGHYRLIGTVLTCIGVIVCLIPVFALIIEIVTFNGAFFRPSSNTLNLIGLILPGLIMTYAGMSIQRGFRKARIFLTKGGESIHLAEVWKKGTESGLYLTSCGKVVSINQDSKGTAHVGYRIVMTNDITCSDCSITEGKQVLDSVAKRRESHSGML